MGFINLGITAWNWFQKADILFCHNFLFLEDENLKRGRENESNGLFSNACAMGGPLILHELGVPAVSWRARFDLREKKLQSALTPCPTLESFLPDFLFQSVFLSLKLTSSVFVNYCLSLLFLSVLLSASLYCR